MRGDAVALRARYRTSPTTRFARRERIALALTTKDGSIELTVDDDGPGIRPEDRGRVFERFVRLDEARSRDAGGSGLGMAIVAEVVAAHGGAVTITDSPLGGARIAVSLPAA